MKTGVVILNYNTAQTTIDCIESVLKFNSAPISIVVVDNASTDDSAKVLSKFVEKHSDVCSLIVSNRNGGYAQGNNIGLKHFETNRDVEDVLILNNDILFVEDIIPQLTRFLRRKDDVGLVSPLLLCRDGVSIDYNCARKDCSLSEVFFSYLLYFRDTLGILSFFSKRRKLLVEHPELLRQESVPVELPSGSCMLISKEKFKEIGYFDPNTFLYYEENILFQKLKSKGLTNYLLPDISCVHLGGVTTNKTPHSKTYMKSSKSSGYYYVTNYRNLNRFQRWAFNMVYQFYLLMVDIVKGIKSIV